MTDTDIKAGVLRVPEEVCPGDDQALVAEVIGEDMCYLALTSGRGRPGAVARAFGLAGACRWHGARGPG